MKVYTCSQARENLTKLLEDAMIEGQVHIKQQDGKIFVLKPYEVKESPLDGVKGVTTDISLEELNEAVRESRERI